MNTYLFKITNNQKFIFIGTLIFILLFCFEIVNHRLILNDFKVYYMASKALMHGEQIYGIPFGVFSGFYKYAPFILFFFAPYTVLPYSVAIIVHFFVISFSIIFFIIVLKQIFIKYQLLEEGKKTYLLLVSVLLCGINHIFRELHLGNTNAIILLLMCLILKFTLESKNIQAGILLSIVILCKPYFLILLLPLFLFGKIKVLVNAGFATIFFLLIPAVFVGISADLALHQEWIKAMLAHDGYLNSFHTITSILKHYLHLSFSNKFHYVILAGIIFSIYLFYFWLNKLADDKNENISLSKNISLIIQYFMAIGIIPNLVTTDTEHFLFSMPLLALLIAFLTKYRNAFLVTGFVMLVLFYEGNSTDWFGHDLSNRIESWGTYGIANMVIIIIVAFVSYRYRSVIQSMLPEKNNL